MKMDFHNKNYSNTGVIPEKKIGEHPLMSVLSINSLCFPFLGNTLLVCLQLRTPPPNYRMNEFY